MAHPARRLGGALEPVVGQVYFASECHEAYAALGFSPSTREAGGVALPDGPAYFTSRGSILGQVPGHVVAAAFGMDARYSPFPVNPATVLDAVSSKLRANAANVIAEAGNRGTTTHVAARELAQDRVLAAMKLRGRVA